MACDLFSRALDKPLSAQSRSGCERRNRLLNRHTVAVFWAAFSIMLTAALSLLSVFYFPEYFILIYLSSVVAALLASGGIDQPEYRLSRLSIAVVFPIFALPLCFFLKRRARKSEMRIMHVGERKENFVLKPSVPNEVSGIFRSVLNLDRFAMASVADCRYFSQGAEMLECMISDVRASQSFVFLEYYIISEGELWVRMLGELSELARRGVEVRVMYDDLGSMKTLPIGYERRLSALGIKARAFYPISGRMSIHNNRNHRKSLIIDGKIAYVGGINLSDEYVGITKPFGEWKDCGMRLEGECVRGLSSSFLSLWSLNDGKEDNCQSFTDEAKKKEDDGSLAVLFSSSPRPFCRRNCAKELLLNIVNTSRHYVYITTPYLVPDFEITAALGRAILRGCSVVILTPGVPDKRMMKILTESFYPHLISLGVKIFEYVTGFMHGKSIVADDTVAAVGSVNLDYRSLAHNFENGALIFNHKAVMDVKRDILDLLRNSRRQYQSTLSLKKKAVRLIAGAVLPIL